MTDGLCLLMSAMQRVTQDRGEGCPCANGGYYTCSDRYNPGVLQDHKWEVSGSLVVICRFMVHRTA